MPPFSYPGVLYMTSGSPIEAPAPFKLSHDFPAGLRRLLSSPCSRPSQQKSLPLRIFLERDVPPNRCRHAGASRVNLSPRTPEESWSQPWPFRLLPLFAAHKLSHPLPPRLVAILLTLKRSFLPLQDDLLHLKRTSYPNREIPPPTP